MEIRLEMVRVQTQVAELTVIALGFHRGRGRGGLPALEATGADLDVLFLFYFSFCL